MPNIKGMNYPVFLAELKTESEAHKELRHISRSFFQSIGYRIGRARVSAYGCRYFADYFVVSPEGQIQFVECLTSDERLGDKLKLLKYAPLWVVLPFGILPKVKLIPDLSLMKKLGVVWVDFLTRSAVIVKPVELQ